MRKSFYGGDNKRRIKILNFSSSFPNFGEQQIQSKPRLSLRQFYESTWECYDRRAPSFDYLLIFEGGYKLGNYASN